jgi:uncharacterized SAM-binding protein YcdF (DUF218 family)
MYVLTQDLLKPFPLLMWLTGAALLMAWRRTLPPRRGWRIVFVVYGLLLLDSLPATSYFVVGWLERSSPRVLARPADARVIVVLGGGVLSPRRKGDPTLPDYSSYSRTMRAWQLYRDGPPRPIVVSGGEPNPQARGEPAARVMAQLLTDWGVPATDVIIEDQSRTTAENAEFSARILRERDLTEGVVMVTSATHQWRAARQFRRAGIAVTPAGCDYYADTLPLNWHLFWPSGTAVSMNQHAWHEYLGAVWYWLRGR